jgi:flavodoxin
MTHEKKKKIAIRYYSKTGHMKRMAEVVAAVTGAEARPVSEPMEEPVDTLFLGSAVYLAGVDAQVKDFIASLDAERVKKVVCFSSAGILTSSYAQVKALLEQRGIAVDAREFHCRGQFALLHRGHPDRQDLDALRHFVAQLEEE